MRNHHFHIQYFNFYDLDGMGRHLEKMAARGWMLEKMTTFGWHYRRMEPKRLRFTVTYHDTFSVFDPEQSEGQQEYQDLCRQSGWEVAAANGPLQAFYTEDEDAPPIETDPQLVLETVERLVKKVRFSSILLLLAALFNFWMLIGRILHNPIHLLASPPSLAGGICWTLLALYSIVALVTYGRWHRKAKAAAAVGEFVQVQSHKWLLRTILGVAALALLYIPVASRLPGYRLLLAVALVLLSLIFFVPSTVQRLLKQRGVSAKVNRRCTILSNVTTTVLVTVLLTTLIFSLMDNPAFTLNEADMTAPLAAADLTGIDDERYVQQVHVDRSIFLNHFTCHEETPFDDGADLPCLSYEIVDLHVPFFYTLCQNELRSHEAAFPTFYLPAPPVADTTKVYALYMPSESLCRFLFCWENRIVELCANWILTNEQLETAARLLAP